MAKYLSDAELAYHETVRQRFERYMDSEPAKFNGVGKAVGLSENLSRYLLSRFVNNKQKLAMDLLTKLSDYLEERNY